MLKEFVTIVSIIFFACSEDITNSGIEPGRRDYVWSIDTIYSFNPIRRIWGSSPDDVWAVNTGTFQEDIHHYDGTAWSTDGIYRRLTPFSIWGFSNNNIFIGGGGGKIWHFDGAKWIEIATLSYNNRTDIVFDNIWGKSSEDLYAFGAYVDDKGYANNPVIAHFNGSWKMLNTNGIIGIVEHLYKEDGRIYLQVLRSGSGQYPDSTIIYEYYKKTYKKLYGNIERHGLQADISIIDEKVYFILGYDIKIRVNNQLDIYLEVDDPNFYQRIWGRNSKDIFLLMTDGLKHYNGYDVEYLFYFNYPRTQIYGSALFKREVFFLVYESPSGLSLIYHGTLQNERSGT